MQRTIAICALLGALTLGIYAQTAGFEFIALDDDAYVTANPVVRAGLTSDGVAWVFTTPHGGNWHPVTGLSHMLDVDVFGLEPGGPHIVNMLLHLLNVLLLFGALRYATGDDWTSALAAALFAVHPLRIESVAWVSERKDVLSMAFGLLAIWSYFVYARRGGLQRYGLTALLLALGLMAKPMLVTLPIVFLMLDFWPLRRMAVPGRTQPEGETAHGTTAAPPNLIALTIEKLPFLVLCAASAGLTLVFQQRAGALGGGDLVPLGGRFANAVVSYVRYLGKTIWPSDLSVMYPHPYLPEGEPWSAGAVAGAALLLVAITSLVVGAKRRYLAVGWCWFIATLLPVIGIVQFGHQAMADRYTYLPSIGLSLMFSWGAKEIVERWPTLRTFVIAFAVAAVAALSYASWLQTQHWRASEPLFRASLAAAPGSPILHNNLGIELLGAGRTDEAISQFEQALALRPDDAKAHNNLGKALRDKGRLDQAIQHLERAVALSPDYADAHINLGAAYKNQRRTSEAIEHLRRAGELRPEDPAVRNNLGTALSAAGETEEAIAVLEALIEDHPTYVRAHANLGNAYARSQDFEAAIPHYRAALVLEPGYSLAQLNLASALRASGELVEAIALYRAFLATRPDEPGPMLQLAGLLASHPDADVRSPQEAIDLASRAISLANEPSAGAFDILACAYAAAGRFENAVELSGMAADLARGSGARNMNSIRAHRTGFLNGQICREGPPET